MDELYLKIADKQRTLGSSFCAHSWTRFTDQGVPNMTCRYGTSKGLETYLVDRTCHFARVLNPLRLSARKDMQRHPNKASFRDRF
jgi:hypothetical protein